MKSFQLKLILFLILITMLSNAWAQNNPASSNTTKDNKVVVITGARFTYPLIQAWIDRYNQANPASQIIIEARGSADPHQYDILAESYEQDEAIKKTREYFYFGRYAILPVANSKSAFTRTYTEKGVTKGLIKQFYFDDLYADKDREQKIQAPYNVYNRLQRAGAPIVFTKYFGFEQKDIKGKAIAGSDEHLLKALLRDSLAISYLPVPVIYDHASGKPVPGLSVLPVDLNDNGKVSDDEKIYADIKSVITHLGEKDSKDINNIPLGYVHFSVSKTDAKPEAIEFLKWVITHGENDLADYGYLKTDNGKFPKEKNDSFLAHFPN